MLRPGLPAVHGYPPFPYCCLCLVFYNNIAVKKCDVLRWRVSQWSKCSACDNKQGTRHRKVQCVRAAARPGEDDVQANLDACKGRVPKQQEECTGTRPCKKTCQKKARSATDPEIKEQSQKLTQEQQRKMIDKFVDLGLSRYLEKSRGVSREDDEFEGRSNVADFRQLLRDWPMTNEDKRKRTCEADKEFTTPKPGSIIKDHMPIDKVVLMQAPYMEGYLQSNLSDKAFQEAGDLVGMGIDTSHEKVYKGAQAVKMIEQLTHRNSTLGARSLPAKENYVYDNLSGIVDADE